MVGVKFIASVSFGKDSLAMLLRLMEENAPLDTVVFYDTGMEFDSIYRNRDKAAGILAQKGIEFVELHPKEPFLFSMLKREVKYRNKEGFHFGLGWCGGPCRWGTTQKVQAITAYRKAITEPVTDYVGIAFDEPERFGKASHDGKTLPLVDWQMTEKDCLTYCRSCGWDWNEHTANGVIDLYDVLSRVSCWCCKNKNLSELRNIYLFLPEYWERLKQLQTEIEMPMKGSAGSVFDLERRFRLEQDWLNAGLSIRSKQFFDELHTKHEGMEEQ